MTFGRLAIILASTTSLAVFAQAPTQPDWKALEDENLRHYQAVLLIDTSASERAAAEYLKEVLDQGRHPGPDLGWIPTAPTWSRG